MVASASAETDTGTSKVCQVPAPHGKICNGTGPIQGSVSPEPDRVSLLVLLMYLKVLLQGVTGGVTEQTERPTSLVR